MSNRINLGRTQHSDRVLTAVAQLREAQAALAHSKAVMEAAIVAGDHSEVETLFGAPEGTGETLYNLVAGVVSDMAGFNISATIARIG